jgi:hypothetical protein
VGVISRRELNAMCAVSNQSTNHWGAFQEGYLHLDSRLPGGQLGEMPVSWLSQDVGVSEHVVILGVSESSGETRAGGLLRGAAVGKW